MEHATQLWMWWLSLLSPLAAVFTRLGGVCFVAWVTGMVLCGAEQTITQILTALGLESRWRVLEHFAEYEAWDRQAVERQTLRLFAQERPARWGRYHLIALDDTKEHRTSQKVWGTGTCHESSARSPHRAETVRAHTRVVLGDWLPGCPWTHRPQAARLYGRLAQLPGGETFQTKTALAVELLRQADAESKAPILGNFDGAYAVDTVVKPCLEPEPGQRRIEIVTRLGVDARLYHPVGPQSRGKGRPATWEPRIPVHVFVVAMAGDVEPWFLVTSALDLSAGQVVEAWTARFRHEDGCRDHKQHLGMEG
jgi:DDE superfamily endonuclease